MPIKGIYFENKSFRGKHTKSKMVKEDVKINETKNIDCCSSINIIKRM